MSVTNEKNKRTRLVESADKLFHEQGIRNSTLANIAQRSDVPLGNVYYYFKSKDSIVSAVIEYRKKILQQQLKQLNAIDDAKSRLVNLIKINMFEEQDVVYQVFLICALIVLYFAVYKMYFKLTEIKNEVPIEN